MRERRRYPRQKNGKIMNGGTCAHEGELVPIEGQKVQF